MKQAAEWAKILKEHCGFGDFGCQGCLDIIRAIQKDAASAASVPDGWQPINTAPKDGTEIDVWCKVCGRVPDAVFNTKKNRWEYVGLDMFDEMDWIELEYPPTHWMPLPPPPKEED